MPEKTIWLYSGFTWIEALSNDLRHKIIEQCDVMVDGRFVDELKDLSLAYRGSANQRVIDVQESLKQNKIILYCD